MQPIEPTTTNTLLTPSTFARAIEDIVQTDQIGYLDAIIEFGEKNALEVEVIHSLIKKSPVIKAKLEAEAVRNRLIRGVTPPTLSFA